MIGYLKSRQWPLYIIFIAIFLAFPFSLFKYTKFFLFLVNMTAIGVIGALGLNILTGYTGLISLGQAAFMGVGAYTVAILSTKVGLPLWINLPAAGVITTDVGIIRGTPSIIFKGYY